MARTSMNGEAVHPEAEATDYVFDNWFDPIEAGLRERVRGFIETMLETELDAVLARPRYGRRPAARSDETTGVAGHRHGHRTRTLTGTFGTTEITVPRARLEAGGGTTVEWKSKGLRAYQRRTMAADALIASVYLAGTNTRRVRRALAALFGGAIGKDVVSRTWRKVKTDWDAWNARSLADEPIVRLILDGTVVRVRLDRKATSISLLVVIVGDLAPASRLHRPDWSDAKAVAVHAGDEAVCGVLDRLVPQPGLDLAPILNATFGDEAVEWIASFTWIPPSQNQDTETLISLW
jgi:putative transposase